MNVRLGLVGIIIFLSLLPNFGKTCVNTSERKGIMHEKNMRYGQFLRAKRLSDSRELTLKDIAAELDVSVSFVSDVEQGRRKPYDEAKTQKLIEFLRLTEEDTALMYDLAAKENSRIPRDLDDIMMYSEAGDMARYALRMTKKGIVDENDWKHFIQYIKTKEADFDD